MMTRRQAIKTTALAAAALATSQVADAQSNVNPDNIVSGLSTVRTPFTLPPLPYAFDALEPHIDAKTMEIHHDRHHKAYVDNLNKAVANVTINSTLTIETLLKDLNSVPESYRVAVRNNGGGHYNHSLFWQMMSKSGGGEPKGELAKAIDVSFGNFGAFKEGFSKAGLGQFGSGWAWLVVSQGKLAIESSANQDSPLMLPPLPKGAEDFAKDYNIGKFTSTKTPLLGLDIWEHAYYLKYQNKRADYITAWWNVVNWDFVADRYAKQAK